MRPISPEELAQLFHETYERLAPKYGYETRPDTSVPWEELREDNKQLMIAVSAEILRALFPPDSQSGVYRET